MTDRGQDSILSCERTPLDYREAKWRRKNRTDLLLIFEWKSNGTQESNYFKLSFRERKYWPYDLTAPLDYIWWMYSFDVPMLTSDAIWIFYSCEIPEKRNPWRFSFILMQSLWFNFEGTISCLRGCHSQGSCWKKIFFHEVNELVFFLNSLNV